MFQAFFQVLIRNFCKTSVVSFSLVVFQVVQNQNNRLFIETFLHQHSQLGREVPCRLRRHQPFLYAFWSQCLELFQDQRWCYLATQPYNSIAFVVEAMSQPCHKRAFAYASKAVDFYAAIAFPQFPADIAQVFASAYKRKADVYDGFDLEAFLLAYPVVWTIFIYQGQEISPTVPCWNPPLACHCQSFLRWVLSPVLGYCIPCFVQGSRHLFSLGQSKVKFPGKERCRLIHNYALHPQCHWYALFQQTLAQSAIHHLAAVATAQNHKPKVLGKTCYLCQILRFYKIGLTQAIFQYQFAILVPMTTYVDYLGIQLLRPATQAFWRSIFHKVQSCIQPYTWVEMTVKGLQEHFLLFFIIQPFVSFWCACQHQYFHGKPCGLRCGFVSHAYGSAHHHKAL